MTKEALKEIYQVLLTEPHTPTVCTKLERIAREALAQPERCKYPNCDYPCMNLPDCQMQGEPTVNTFNPDLDGVAMMYEEMKAMARELEELKAQPEQKPDRFCDANCTWSEHHPDCKYGTQNSDELTIAYMSGLYDGKKQANPEQELVAFESLLGAIARGWCHEKNANKEMDSDLAIAIAAEVKAIYTTPPQRTWVGLSDEERGKVYKDWRWSEGRTSNLALCKDIEAKLKEKNT